MIYIVDIEAVETRYTGQWETHVPNLFESRGQHVQVIRGPKDIPQATTPGAFLNFGGTNVYKSAQVEQLGRLFCDGAIKSGDHFIFTDAWHPGIINLKYMSQLLNIPVKIHALWHAGSYDPQDFLGRLVGDAPWVRHAEKSFYHAIDYNYFATDFHIHMFYENLIQPDPDRRQTMYKTVIDDTVFNKKVIRTGWPMEYMAVTLQPFKNIQKKNMILFPHRIAPEKQVEIFRDLATQLPEYEFVVCQDQQLTKDEYHTLLAESKIVFSCSLQETLGIGCYEGALLDAIPLVPDRLSYSEMYDGEFKYPSEWTQNWDSYINHRPLLVEHIRYMMDHQPDIVGHVRQQARDLSNNFFSAKALLENINE
jgi:glycosyltransferase involved in cell wall biosynthesis